jgi:hypothetical protein
MSKEANDMGYMAALNALRDLYDLQSLAPPVPEYKYAFAEVLELLKSQYEAFSKLTDTSEASAKRSAWFSKASLAIAAASLLVAALSLVAAILK